MTEAAKKFRATAILLRKLVSGERYFGREKEEIILNLQVLELRPEGRPQVELLE